MKRQSQSPYKPELRPNELLVPEVRLPSIAKEARRQSLLVAKKEADKKIGAFLDAVRDTEGWL